MQYNNELQIIDTEQKAYLLGFLFSDGCITKGNTVRISLVDKEIIDKLAIEFPFFNTGSFDFSIYHKNNKIQYSLVKQNSKLYQDLTNHGLIERKSTENSNLLILPNLKNELMNHFIRGYFDGNGSISIPKTRPNLRRIEICSSSKTFIETLKNYLESININCPYYREKQNTSSILYVLEWIKNEDIIIFKDFLYKNSTISLKRKKEIFDNFVIIDKTDNNPRCPYCNNKSINNGNRKTNYGIALRYECQVCKKQFTIKSYAELKLDELLETP